MTVDVTSTLVMVPTIAIKPYHRNARKNEATVAKLVELIPKTGFNVPLVLDRQNVIVKGHTRWKAAIRLGLRELPCVYSDADPETIKLDRLADNRLQELSLWDSELLRAELAELKGFGAELASLKFEVEIPRMELAAPGSEPAPPAIAEQPAGPSNPAAPDDRPLLEAADAPPSAPTLETPEFFEVSCSHCGAKLRVKE
jgi:site-specific DNA-methyltransferase (adenine-specific)